MMKYWMVLRYLKDGRKYLNLSFVLSVVGVALGVAALVIAMAVVSGYEATLRESVLRLQGYVMVVRRGGLAEGREHVEAEMRKAAPEISGLTPFAIVEGLIVHNKKLSGVVLEGFDPQTVQNVLALEKTLVSGQLFWRQSAPRSEEDSPPAAVIGKGIATRFNLKVGDIFKLIVPVSTSAAVDGFKPKMQKFVVSGVVDLGRTDYDERYIVTDLTTAQKFGDLGGKISGWRLALRDHDLAEPVVQRLRAELGDFYWIRSWQAANPNLFQAVKYERVVIFVIVMLMLIAAAFNVASTLYLSVVKRYAQISLLKAIGADSRFVRQLFTSQGLIVGVLGALLGILWGWLGCHVFVWAEKKWGLFPGEVYKLDYVKVEMRPLDMAIILSATMLICYVATLAPARRGAKLQPVEGLRYE